MQYTRSEQTDKKYTVNDAFNVAVLRCDGRKICVDHIYSHHLSYQDAVTLEKMNEIADALVDDTNYYDYGC
jgi:hypothetical protein